MSHQNLFAFFFSQWKIGKKTQLTNQTTLLPYFFLLFLKNQQM